MLLVVCILPVGVAAQVLQLTVQADQVAVAPVRMVQGLRPHNTPVVVVAVVMEEPRVPVVAA